MSSILEKIKEIEEEIRRTQKNKATEKHLGILKAKLAKLREKLYSSSKKSSGRGFAVSKSGDATVVLVGFPSVGKSTLLSRLTNVESKSADYAFTTTSVIPGMMQYNGARIQILDLPGILEGASMGKGRGREILSVARTADLLLIIVEAFHWHRQLTSIMKELYAMGFRLNKKPKEVNIERKERGGVVLFKPKDISLSKNVIEGVLREYGIYNALVSIREDLTVDEFIDALEGNRIYVPALAVLNKSDLLGKEEIEKIKKDHPEFILVSAETGQGLEELKEKIFSSLKFIRVYTKPLGGEVSKEPMLLREGATVKDAVEKIHRGMLERFKYALISGPSAKFPNQRVGLDHVLKDGDILTIVSEKI